VRETVVVWTTLAEVAVMVTVDVTGVVPLSHAVMRQRVANQISASGGSLDRAVHLADPNLV
jgi:hypothetical protein